MEQWRLILAIVLSIFVFLLWEFLFATHPDPTTPVTDKPAETQQFSDQTETSVQKSQPLPLDGSGQSESGQSFQSVTVKSSLYTARISEKGAAITSFVLQKYREEVGKNSPLKEMLPGDNPNGTALVHMGGADPDQWFNAPFKTDYAGDTLTVNDTEQSISFFWDTPQGLVIEKRYTFIPESYLVRLKVFVKNPSERAVEDQLILTMQNQVPEERSRFAFEGPFAYINGELEEIDVDDIPEKPQYSGRIEWAGLSDRYFMTTAMPHAVETVRLSLAHNPDTEMVAVNLAHPSRKISANMQDVFQFSLYLGPKRMSILRQHDNNLAKAINFGFFDVIAKPCLWLMNYLHDHFIPNWGVAIILLTILFKLIFWPLGSKSYRSMAEMKKLQPLMSDIRKKYKDDKKKMNEEVMRLYKTYKVNPMSGCLPMVAQIPVFIAFYRMLYEAIELRHAPFILWINDLSAPDRLFHFDVTIPLMLPPYGIPVLTIIMGATMFLQQKLSPPPGDPSQAKFMMMMPLIFTFIFINFPSGLVLYWLVNNVISIAQQYYITKKIV